MVRICFDSQSADWCVVVDAAYAETDPQRRIAFVAAFAMSNYSSTIGRIAKPFNPMLVRTFFTKTRNHRLIFHRARRSSTSGMTSSTATFPSK